MAAAVAAMMVAIPMVMAEVRSEVRREIGLPPPIVAEEEWRQTGLLASRGRGAHGSPAWSELEGLRGTTARPKVVHPLVSHGVLVVDIPFSGEEYTRVEPPAIPLSRELVMI